MYLAIAFLVGSLVNHPENALKRRRSTELLSETRRRPGSGSGVRSNQEIYLYVSLNRFLLFTFLSGSLPTTLSPRQVFTHQYN